MALGNIPTGGNFAPRIDEALGKAFVSNKELRQSVFRAVPDRPYLDMYVAIHSVYLPPEEGKANKYRWRSHVCRNWNPTAMRFEDNGCLFCKMEVQASRELYINMIDRAAQDSPPSKRVEPSDWELDTGFIDLENGSRTWTPLRVLRLSASTTRTIQTIGKSNIVKGTAYGVDDPDYGIDLVFTYDETAAPSKRLTTGTSMDGRSALTDEELNYCYYKLDPEVYFPQPDLKDNYRFIKANVEMFTDREGKEPVDVDLVLDVLDEYEREHGAETPSKASRGKASSRAVGSAGGNTRRSEDQDDDDNVPPRPSRGAAASRRAAVGEAGEDDAPPPPPRAASRGRAAAADADATPPRRRAAQEADAAGEDDAPPRRASAGAGRARGAAAAPARTPRKTTRMEKQPNPDHAVWKTVAALGDAFADLIEPSLDKLSESDYDFVSPFYGDENTPPSVAALFAAIENGQLNGDDLFDMVSDCGSEEEANAAADAFDDAVKAAYEAVVDLLAAQPELDLDAVLEAGEPPATIEVEVEVEAEEDAPQAEQEAPRRAGRARGAAAAKAEDDQPVRRVRNRAEVAASASGEAGDDDEDRHEARTQASGRRSAPAAAETADPTAGRPARRAAPGARRAASFEDYDD